MAKRTTPTEDAPREPALEAGATIGSARSLLLTILGEFVWPDDYPVWTSSLLYVLEGLGFEERTARQSIARGAAAGWITNTRHGRAVSWSLTSAGHQLISAGSQRVRSFTNEPWDGRWLVLSITVRQSHRAARKKLYAGLHWAGFGSPTPGVWVSPHTDRQDEVNKLIEELDLTNDTISFTGTVENIGISDDELVRRSWDLDELNRHFEEILVRYAGLDPRPGDEMLFTNIRAVSELQRLPFLNPGLPDELLPDWVGRQAVSTLMNLRKKWSGAARQRWNELNADA